MSISYGISCLVSTINFIREPLILILRIIPSYGDPNVLLRSYNSTAVGIERTAGIVRNIPLALDELQSLSLKYENLSRMMYMLGNGIGKMRGDRIGGTQKMQTWCNTILSTGEQPITVQNSMDGENGILTGAGNKKWYTSTVKKILTNEKYIGDALLQKTCTIDILNKTRVANNGIAPQYYVEDDHEAIIPKEIYMKVQEELVRRRNVQASPSGKKRMYSCTHCFSQVVVCGNCGEVFKRIHWNNHGCRSIVWRCASRLEQNDAVCNARTVNEKELEQVVLRALNEMLGAKTTYKKQLQKNLMLVLQNDTSAQKDRIAERLLVLQQELLNRANNREAYDDVAEEIFHLRELQQQTDSDETTKAIQMERIKELQDFIGQQSNELTEFDEKLVKRWLRQITVWDDHYTVELKSGLSIDASA